MSNVRRIPQTGEVWKHHSGRFYVVENTSNLLSDRPEFLPTVIYMGPTGVIYSRPVSEFLDKFALVCTIEQLPAEQSLTDIQINRMFLLRTMQQLHTSLEHARHEGKSGWHTAEVQDDDLADSAAAHLHKGKLVPAINYLMFLHSRAAYPDTMRRAMLRLALKPLKG